MKKKYILSSINIIVFIIFSIILDISYFKINNINKYLIVQIIFQIILFIISLIAYFNKKNIIYNTGVFILFLVNIINCFYLVKYNKEYDIITNIIYNKYEYKEYHAYVLKSTKYSNIKEIKYKKVGILNNNYENACNNLKSKNIKCIKYNTNKEIINDIETGKIQAIYTNEKLENFEITTSNYRDIYQSTVKYLK